MRVTIAVLAFDGWAFALMQSSLVPALPDIQRTLGASPAAAAWVITAFVLSAAVATPVVGKLGDMHGKQRVLTIVLGGFVVGTLLGAVSDSLGLLIIARALQGIAGGVLPLAFAIVRDELPPQRVAGAIGTVYAAVGIGTFLGIGLGGLVVETLGYRWLFWLPLAPLAAGSVATAVLVRESPIRHPGRIAWPAVALLALGLVAVLLAIDAGGSAGWGSSRQFLTAGVAAGLLTLWVLVDARSGHPLVDMRMLAIPTVWRSNVACLTVATALFCGFILIPQLVEAPVESGYGLGATPSASGLYLLPAAVMMLAIGLATGTAERLVGAKAMLVVGIVVPLLGFVLLALGHSHPWQVYVGSLGLGTGMGLAFVALPNLILAAVPAAQSGVSLGINSVTRWVGGALGTQVSASVLAGSLAAGGAPTSDAFTLSFAIAAGALAVALVAALAIPGRVRA